MKHGGKRRTDGRTASFFYSVLLPIDADADAIFVLRRDGKHRICLLCAGPDPDKYNATY